MPIMTENQDGVKSRTCSLHPRWCFPSGPDRHGELGELEPEDPEPASPGSAADWEYIGGPVKFVEKGMLGLSEMKGSKGSGSYNRRRVLLP